MRLTVREPLFSVTKKDLEISWYKSPGAGGQKKNKTANACRIRHPESGVIVTASERRERSANLKSAFTRLTKHPRFLSWMRRRTWELENKTTVEKEAQKQMRPSNLKIEVRKGGTWIEDDVPKDQ